MEGSLLLLAFSFFSSFLEYAFFPWFALCEILVPGFYYAAKGFQFALRHREVPERNS